MKRHPCPICATPPHKREQLRDGAELCNGCGFAIRLGADGELLEWATTSKSHPRGVWNIARAVASMVVAVAVACGVSSCRTAEATPRLKPDPVRQLVLDDNWSQDFLVCVPLDPVIAFAAQPLACITMRDLRVQLRGIRRTSHTGG